ncbi:MAG: DNA mismatch repair protein MutS [Candidatus Zixiibacteriota bacterium]
MTTKQTPLLEQYFAIKKQHPDKILFFRMGDFYEMFGRDAEIAAPILGIALTSRSHGQSTKMPLAGVPYHSAEKYLAQLIKAGLKVAICEQTEDPKLAKGLVKRDVIEIITPGTVTVDGAMTPGHESMLASVYTDRPDRLGIAALEIATGRVIVFEGATEAAYDKLESLNPQEIIISDAGSEAIQRRAERWGAQISKLESWRYQSDFASEKVRGYYKIHSLEAFELSERPLAVATLGSLLSYVEEMKFAAPLHLNPPRFAEDADHVYLDASSVRNLELLASNSSEKKEHSLMGLLDFCSTGMGRRCLARWLVAPLKNIERINRRHEAVALFVQEGELREALINTLSSCADLERLSGKLGYRKANPRDLVQLRHSLNKLPQIKSLLANTGAELLAGIAGRIPNLDVAAHMIATALVDEPPLLTNSGGMIRPGFNNELDALKGSIKEAVDYVATLQEKLRNETGISSLKVGYNSVFGYYIEVTKAQQASVPQHFVRKQTLVNAERYITDELKQKEELILAAEDKINALEERVFLELREQVSAHIEQINLAGRLLGELDVLLSFAVAARKYNYNRPQIANDPTLEIIEGRHPVIEQLLPRGDFVGNDTRLDTASQQIQLLTGPNMAGKSTYLRQVGLIVIMAQAGSFVPAESAVIGVVDRVFTRVGASDRLTMGESTFLVEMNETSRILNNATPQSLILLDEVGRGTSTYDGLAIAWALCEMLHNEERLRSRTIFATHFHELTELPSLCPRIHNYQVQVRRNKDRIVFLRKVVSGGCDDSFGIEVAKLAGIPNSLTHRAKEILEELETGKFEPLKTRSKYHYINPNQLGLFEKKESESLKRLQKLEIDNLTPIEALNVLAELKEQAEREHGVKN